MNYREAIAELDSRQPGRMVPDLSRIRALAELMNDPQLTYPTIHVTGTNGKTTTARLIGLILCAHGVATGVYTSPHLDSVTERFSLCEDDITEREFALEYGRLRPYLEEVDRRGERVTYFETLTALGYLWFADKPVDAAVFEVGMGGTWDATNLIRAKVCVFCQIDLDHPELGSTIEEVAREKAGIIKEGSTVVIQDPSPAVLANVQVRAIELGAPALVRGHDYWVVPEPAVGGWNVSVRTNSAEYPDLFLPLHGWHQVENAATAIAAAEAFLGGPLEPDALGQALAGARSPGRMEVIGRRPLVVIDGAHNPAGARAVATTLGQEFVWDRLHLVVAVSANKDIEGIVRSVAPLVPATVIATQNSSARSAPAVRVAEAFRAVGVEAETVPSVVEALDVARTAAGEGDLILVTGSLYTVADARRAIVT